MDAPATGAGTGAFSSTLTGLAPETSYYARAYATSAIGTGYGADITFKTASSTRSVGFALIPAGPFQMGDAMDGLSDAPVRIVNVSAFYIGKTEVTKAEWDEVFAWGVPRGYDNWTINQGKASNHPVQTVTWFDVIRWCNARSEKDGLEPCYRVNGNIMRTESSVPTVNWGANGYRLPTEAEWEKAARGGLGGKRFPWGDTISHSQSTYQSNGAYAYDVSPTESFHPTYGFDGPPYTAPVGSFDPNGYGLYDMSGNVMEWCWDWYGNYATGAQSDPKGVTAGLSRVLRGGSWLSNANGCRVAGRHSGPPGNLGWEGGFRVVRSSIP
jgi:formylglycine-generating enzyme required for sulfatase activity